MKTKNVTREAAFLTSSFIVALSGFAAMYSKNEGSLILCVVVMTFSAITAIISKP